MSTEQVSMAPMNEAIKHVAAHPLCPITASEIKRSAEILRGCWPTKTNLHFKAITLEEPAKTELVPYLEAEHRGSRLPHIDRRVFVSYYIRNTDKLHEAILNLTRQKVESNVKLGPNIHGPGDWEEILTVEKVALEDASVKAEIAKLGLPKGTAIVSDPWIYGSDGVDDDRRMYQCFLYMCDPNDPSNEDSNYYAFPLAISPVVDVETLKVARIDLLPTGAGHQTKATQPIKINPPNEYTPEHHQLRRDLKPLNVVQPEGASFRVIQSGETGEIIEWQKWSFRVGFNQREGMVLYDVRYAGRSLFYRLALSDMNIPYADPRHPFHKKAAFDLGDAGAGTMANNLKLGCDCLGSIHYLSAVLADDNGRPLPMDNVVCVHEQDAGIGWKHTNYRTGRAALVRSRELVIQSIITVANYEYIMAFMFNQAGELTYEVRATGVVSTQPIDEGVDVPWGTIVHPGVLAAHHQHIFSLRVDPAIDGHANTLVYEEVHPMPRSEFNPHGVGYTVEETVVRKSGGLDTDYTSNRVFKIQNESSRNPVNGKAVAYKVHAPAFQKMIADPDSYHHKRAEFADHNIYVTKYHDGELYAGGKYTNQSRGGAGVRAWANRKENVVNDDIVLWVQFGLQHVTRIEDFPVMPCEVIKVQLKPVNFFDKNPALDVPPSSQEFNCSTDISEQHKQPSMEAKVKHTARVDQAVAEMQNRRTHSDALRREAMRKEGKRIGDFQLGAHVIGTPSVEGRENAGQREVLAKTAGLDQQSGFTARHVAFRAQIEEQGRWDQLAKKGGMKHEGEGQKRRRIHRQRLGRLERKIKIHASLEEDLAEQERQRWREDGEELWRQQSGEQDPRAEFTGPAPPLTDLVESQRERLNNLWRHRERVRSLRDENRDGTKDWNRVQLASKEKEADDQKGSGYGNRVSFGSYSGEQHMPASDPNVEAQQQHPDFARARAGQVTEQRRTGVPALGDGHLATTNQVEAQEMTNIPKLEDGAKLYYTPGTMTVEQAEVIAHLKSVDMLPQLVKIAMFPKPVSNQSAFQYEGAHYNNKGYKIQPVPTKRSGEKEPVMSVDGPMYPRNENVEIAVEPAATSCGGSQGEITSGRGRVARGEATTRGKGGIARGGGTTNRGTEAGGGFQTALPQQAITDQHQRSYNHQWPSKPPMRGSSVITGQDSRNEYVQMGEMRRPSTDPVRRTTGTMNEQVQAYETPQGRPSGFMPMTIVQNNPCQGPQRQRPVPAQSQQDATISSIGPIPGTSYTYAHLEGGRTVALTPQDRAPQQAFPIPVQRPPVMLRVAESPIAPPSPLFTHGEDTHGEHDMQCAMPPSAERYPQQSLPSPYQRPAIPRVIIPPSAESGPYQILPSPCQRSQNILNPTTAPAPWPPFQRIHDQGRAGDGNGQALQPTVPAPVERGGQTSPPVQHSQPAIAGTAVIDFATRRL